MCTVLTFSDEIRSELRVFEYLVQLIWTTKIWVIQLYLHRTCLSLLVCLSRRNIFHCTTPIWRSTADFHIFQAASSLSSTPGNSFPASTCTPFQLLRPLTRQLFHLNVTSSKLIVCLIDFVVPDINISMWISQIDRAECGLGLFQVHNSFPVHRTPAGEGQRCRKVELPWD